MKKGPEKILTTELDETEVVQAWWSLGALPSAAEHVVPPRVELLRKRPKSIVYRLPGLGEKGTDVIAKHCLRESALAEKRVYEVLERLPIETMRYYGYVGNGTDDFCWLFLEDAGGEPLDPEEPRQRDLATRWLADLHTTSSRLEEASRLPERGPAHYRRHLRAAQRSLDHILDTMDLPAGGEPLLRQVQLQLDAIVARWIDVEALCRAMPWALVHGDFAERNVRVRHNGQPRSELLAFDWEVAGWGFPGADLGFVDLGVYEECVRDAWPQVVGENLQRFAHLGGLLRGGIAAVHWEALKLEAGWPEKPLFNMQIYLDRIQEAFRGLDWQVPGHPPSQSGREGAV